MRGRVNSLEFEIIAAGFVGTTGIRKLYCRRINAGEMYMSRARCDASTFNIFAAYTLQLQRVHRTMIGSPMNISANNGKS